MLVITLPGTMKFLWVNNMEWPPCVALCGHFLLVVPSMRAKAGSRALHLWIKERRGGDLSDWKGALLAPDLPGPTHPRYSWAADS